MTSIPARCVAKDHGTIFSRSIRTRSGNVIFYSRRCGQQKAWGVYRLVFLHFGRRRVWIAPGTVQPDSAGVSLQARNFLIVAEDMGVATEYVKRRNDAKSSTQFNEVLKSSGVIVKRNTPLSPNLRAHVERFTQTLMFECVDKFVVAGENPPSSLATPAHDFANRVCGVIRACGLTFRLYEIDGGISMVDHFDHVEIVDVRSGCSEYSKLRLPTLTQIRPDEAAQVAGELPFGSDIHFLPTL